MPNEDTNTKITFETKIGVKKKVHQVTLGFPPFNHNFRWSPQNLKHVLTRKSEAAGAFGLYVL